MNEQDMYFDIKDEEFEKIFNSESGEFEKIKEGKVIISLYGDVNSGKSQTINALTGRKLSKVTAYAGETTDVLLHKYSENVFIADTPGLNDKNTNISEKSIEFIQRDTDIIILFFNAAVGACATILETYHNLKKMNKPIILVLNKIDIWNDEDEGFDSEALNTVVDQIRKETGENVIPISAKKKVNIEHLNNKIIELLSKDGKEVLFSKVSIYKDKQVAIWINVASTSAFGIGIIPLPGADMIPLTTLQVGLALKIAYIYNCKVSKNEVMGLIASTVTGNIGKQVFKIGLQGLKGLGWLGGPLLIGATATLAGSIAASVTYGFGYASKAYYKSGMQLDIGSMGDIYKEAYNKYYGVNSEVAATTK